MADPILPDYFKVMSVFQHASGLPEDRFINNWYFRNDIPNVTIGESIEDVASQVRTVLDAFYYTAAANSHRIAQYIPVDVVSHEYRIYDLGETPPRTPHVAPPDTTTAFATTGALPYECSVVLSLRTGFRHPSGRGRLFLGPLTIGAVAGINGKPAVRTDLRDAIIDRANNVLNTPHPIKWVVVSGTRGEANEVTGGYVDDAWDTQRRRGPKPTSRVGFGAYTPE